MYTSMSAVKCFKCGKKGHLARLCHVVTEGQLADGKQHM